MHPSFGIYYKLSSGDFVGRVPPKVIEYGFNDTFLVAKFKQNDVHRYYVINRFKDFEYADGIDFLADSSYLTEGIYSDKWRKKLNIDFKKLP